MKKLKAYGLSDDTFTGYGLIISEPKKEPNTDNNAFKHWGNVAEVPIASGSIETGLLLCTKKNLSVDNVERHVNTPEILVVLEGDAIVVVALKGDEINDLRAFHIKCGEAIIMHAGTWHSVPVPVKNECKLLVLFKKGTGQSDLDVRKLFSEVEIEI
jgi:ureidoglycolate hydrolase